MSQASVPLLLDLLEWLSSSPRSYGETMEAWRTSCPRLTIWEDALDAGFVVRERSDAGVAMVRITECGRSHLARVGSPYFPMT